MFNPTPRQPIYQADTDTYLIPLTRGKHAIVDACDVELATQVSWQAHPEYEDKLYYATRTYQVNGRRMLDHLHRLVMARVLGRDLEPEERIDHVNRDGLDCRRENLRLATHAQNMANRRLFKNNTSGVRGVSWHKAKGKWCARISVNGKRILLGYFDEIEDAKSTYEKAAVKHFGEFYGGG